MKRSDLKQGTLFRLKRPTSIYYEIMRNPAGLYVSSLVDAERENPFEGCLKELEGYINESRFEGYIKETDSNKGFTLTRHILGRQVGAFFPFNNFEVIK